MFTAASAVGECELARLEPSIIDAANCTSSTVRATPHAERGQIELLSANRGH
jgi:hypothetical protein